MRPMVMADRDLLVFDGRRNALRKMWLWEDIVEQLVSLDQLVSEHEDDARTLPYCEGHRVGVSVGQERLDVVVAMDDAPMIASVGRHFPYVGLRELAMQLGRDVSWWG